MSGGSDSRALLEAVAHWPHRFDEIYVASVDHGTRPETRLEAEAVCARARVLGFEARVLALGPEIQKDEASLRNGRYRAIWQWAEVLGVTTIVTAHTQDDQAESFVMDLMGLGGGPEGAGMPIVMQAHDHASIIRPLLSFSRAELIAVLTALQIKDYFVDPTNTQSEGRRVQVRDFLKLHPMPKTRLAALAEKRRADLEALQSLASDLVQETPAGISVKLDLKTPEALKFQALKQGLSRLLPGEDLRSSGAVLRQIARAKITPGKIYHLPGSIIKTGNGRAVLTQP